MSPSMASSPLSAITAFTVSVSSAGIMSREFSHFFCDLYVYL